MDGTSLRVELYVVESDKTTKRVKRLLAKHGVEVVVRGCPRSAAEWMEFPLIRESSGSSFCGEQGIRAYVAKLRTTQTVKSTLASRCAL